MTCRFGRGGRFGVPFGVAPAKVRFSVTVSPIGTTLRSSDVLKLAANRSEPTPGPTHHAIQTNRTQRPFRWRRFFGDGPMTRQTGSFATRQPPSQDFPTITSV